MKLSQQLNNKPNPNTLHVVHQQTPRTFSVTKSQYLMNSHKGKLTYKHINEKNNHSKHFHYLILKLTNLN